MKKKLETRLQDLKAEYQKGQERLTALEQETATVLKTMILKTLEYSLLKIFLMNN